MIARLAIGKFLSSKMAETQTDAHGIVWQNTAHHVPEANYKNFETWAKM